MVYVLEMEFKTVYPIVISSKKKVLHLFGCELRWTVERAVPVSKIHASKPMYPFHFVGYFVQGTARFICGKRETAFNKLTQMQQVRQLGRLLSEGYGTIRWLRYRLRQVTVNQLEEETAELHAQNYRRIKLNRFPKGLSRPLCEEMELLTLLALSHDLVRTEVAGNSYQSKLGFDLPLRNPEIRQLLNQSHEKTPHNEVIRVLQYYDHLAAMLTRRVRSFRKDRRNWFALHVESTKKELRQEMTNLAEAIDDQNPCKAYELHYRSKTLKLLSESKRHAHSSIWRHNNLIIKLAMRDYKRLGKSWQQLFTHVCARNPVASSVPR